MSQRSREKQEGEEVMRESASVTERLMEGRQEVQERWLSRTELVWIRSLSFTQNLLYSLNQEAKDEWRHPARSLPSATTDRRNSSCCVVSLYRQAARLHPT